MADNHGPPNAAPLDLVELDRLLRAAVPEARLVAPRVLRRVITRDRDLPGLGLHVPHFKSHLIARDRLLAIAGPDVLGESAGDLPAQLLLVVRPEPIELAERPRDEMLLAYWRLLFHGCVHRDIERRQLSTAAVRERIHRIGQVEFNEVRTVLRQERYLLPPHDDRSAYEEFAALYLDLSCFAVTLLPHYFPAIEHFKIIDDLLARDVDTAALFAATRLAGAPDPSFLVDGPARAEQAECAPEPAPAPVAEQKAQLLTGAEKAATAGNAVRAAIRRTQAGESAAADIGRLVERLQTALHVPDAEADGWRQAISALLAPAAHGIWPPEARLLYDLQKVCVEQEQPISELNLVEWLYGGLRGPLVRPLPNQPLVLAVKHLRRAAGRLPAVRVGESERHALAVRLHDALHHAEERLRDRFRPLLVDALREVGLRPENFPERVAHDQLIEELLDHITEHGFLNIGHLRDALARNQLKLPDLNGVGEFFAGDPLLRANRQLAQQAAGVYQRGEIYLRWLQRGSALAFGTRPGRWLTRFVALPFGGAYATIIFAEEMLHLAEKVLHPGQPPFHLHSQGLKTTIAGLGLFYLLLLHVPAFRNLFLQGCRLAWSGVRAACVDWPLALWRLPAFRRLVSSAAFVALVRYVVKPLPVAVLVGLSLWLSGRSVEVSLRVGGAVLLVASLALNSRWARLLEDALIDWAARRWNYFRELIPGLVRLVMDTFKTVLEAIDRLLYTVDEWLRFRGGERGLTRAFKAILGLAWSVVSYLVRMVVIVFVEPTVNPVKHFPAVTVAAKLLVPFWVELPKYLGAPFLFLGEALAYSIGFFILHLLPGAAGFLVWELQENWRLYRANRSRTLRPAGIGHHGETLVQLLKPGFHSGTLPKLFARLRRAERRALRTRNWQTSRRLRTALHHVEHGIHRFAERELLAYLNGHPRWTGGPLHVVRVEAGSNRVRLELTCSSLTADPLELHFEEQSGWLVAHVARPGRVTGLAADQAALWTLALTGFYQRCGVDLVREQLEAHLPRPCPPYDITDAGLLVWPGPGYEVEVLYDLHQGPRLFSRVLVGKADALPVLDARQLRFGEQPMPWVEWVKAWEEGAAGPVGASNL